MNKARIKLYKNFLYNESGVLGLPLRLTVSLVLGAVVLAAVVSLMMQPCLFPEEMIVDITPRVSPIAENNTIVVSVSDREGHGIAGVNVIVLGNGLVIDTLTNSSGEARVNFMFTLDNSTDDEWYFDIRVQSSGCYQDFSAENAFKLYLP